MPEAPGGGGRDRSQDGGEERPGRRSGPRPARDIASSPAVEGVRRGPGRKGRGRGRGPRSVRRGAPAPAPVHASSGPVHQIVEVRFQGVRSEYFSFRGHVPLRVREYVIVEADRGQDLGWVRRVSDAGTHTCEGGCDHAHHGPVVPPADRVLRRAAPVDVERSRDLQAEEAEIRRRTRELVQRHGLKMKISEAEWQWDRNKLTVYFTAERRVDFRGLVKDMARTFKTRIELRQIGVRDEAKRLGGIGRCGRELCCRLWLPRIEPVTLQLAKDQGLSLNPAQISGACGRLMSCLHYEHAMYVQAKKRFPRRGKRIRTERGEEKVLGWDLFRETVALRAEDGSERTVPLAELKAEATRARRAARDAAS
ncbi:MAG: regulatory iron-sulfur-containing complex subunit RicT [Gemmatimonadota bacterium]|nr:regulatory iron-sulfur-containing complex subunit RicT [Gemmatimonadota bacterium]